MKQDDMMQRQMELEAEMQGLGIERYYYKHSSSGVVTEKDNMDRASGKNLLQQYLGDIEQGVVQFLDDVANGHARRHATAAHFIRIFHPRITAYIVARQCISGLGKREKFTHVAHGIADALLDHLEFAEFEEQNPALFSTLVRDLKRSHSGEYKRTVLMHSKAKAGIAKVQWDIATRLQVGTKLIEIFIETTGLVEKVLFTLGKDNRVSYLVATEAAMEWLQKADDKCAIMSPVFLPMVVPPKPWQGVYGGGYYSAHGGRMKLVKTFNRNYLEELSHKDISSVLSSVNALQATPWRINKGVMHVLKQLWMEGGGLAGLPPRENLDIPSKPVGFDSDPDLFINTYPEAWKAWKRAAAEVHTMNAKLQSKRISVSQKLWIAQKFQGEERFYFPHELDWRGRAYSMVSFVNPQSDDSGKALLEFAEGHPLGEQGAAWLAIHGANCYGVDKVSFDDRIAWVQENQAAILDSAINPLDGSRFWADADSPFQFLAFCMDWAGFVMEGPEHVSHLPVGLDGSCNGIQNFSAMLRDEVGGRAVNLLPAEKPADIYGEVAKVAAKIVERDAAAGNELAKLWEGKVTRKITKRNTMTVPYGVSRYGMREQLVGELKGMLLDGVNYLEVDNIFPAAQYMAGVNHQAIGEVVIAAREAMGWLQKVAKVAASNSLPIYWNTPMGFLVFQSYKRQVDKRLRFWFQGNQLNIYVRDEEETIDKKRQEAGIAPNFVHSMDAAHMMRTVNLCAAEGINSFAMVHDSYGVHAAFCDPLARLLREAFIQQYSVDVLEDFRQQIIQQLPEELHEKIPPVPPKGTLDLELIREAEYFFA